MSNVNANINVLINTQGAISGLRTLQSQINNFNQSVAASNAAMATSQKQLTSNLAAQIAATGAFSTSLQKVETGASRLQTAIDRNKLSLGEYFKYGIASSGVFGRVFNKEHNEIMDLAADRVKRLQTQYLALGRAQNGMVDTMAVRPLQLHNADAAVAVQRQQLFNKLLRDGATSMVNWGKNTQWAGRQLMVGFTVPLTIFGGYAASVFMDLDKQITQFRRVYGDSMTPTAEADAMVQQIQDIAKEYTKYGITVADSIEMAAKAAATGLQQDDLLAATEEALRLATLGQIDYQQALDATISLQSAFDISSQDLANTIDFLNATENQTIVSLDDISQAIPRVAPVIKGLGGDVRDLAAFLAAMREGGVNAAEGANALKSGLASLINPSNQANEVLKEMGINIDQIVTKNEGDLMGTVQDFALAIQDLSNLDRQKALATLFGKYQFARMGALFKNIIRDGSQAQRVIDLAGMSVKELAALSEKDLARLEESVGTRFLGAFERFKLAIAPIGEEFLKIATPILEWVTNIFERFNELSPEVKKWGLILIGALGGVLPIFVMVAGLFGNFLGNMVKGGSIIKSFFSRLIHGGRKVDYLRGELLDSVAATNSLEGATNGVTQALNVQRGAVVKLMQAYDTFLIGARQSLSSLPTTIVAPTVVPSPTPTAPVPAQPVPPVQTPQQAQKQKKYSYGGYYSKNGRTMVEHMVGAGGIDEARAKQEYDRAQKAAEAARRAVTRHYIEGLGQTKLTAEQKRQIDSMTQIDRAHIVAVDKSLAKQSKELMERVWDPRLWVAQPAVENQLSNALRQSPRTMALYESTLRQIYGDTQESNALMGRVNAGLALTEEQLQMQARILRRMVRDAAANPKLVSDQFVPWAKGAIASAESRARQTGPGYFRSDVEIMAAEEQLESELRQRIAAENAAEASSKEVAATGQQLADSQRRAAAAHNAASGTAAAPIPKSPPPVSDDRPAPKPQTQGLGMGPGGQKGWLAGGESPYAKQSEKAASNLERETKKASGAISRGANAFKNSIGRGASAFGNSLIQGSGKLQGGLFALDGLVIGLSMMDNQVGQFANQIMPAIFAFQGITMMLPMLANPWGLLIAAVVAAGAGLFITNMMFDNMRKEAQNMADSLASTRSTVDKVGEFYGRESLVSQAQTQQTARVAGQDSEAIEQARQFLASDVGATMFSGIQEAIQTFGKSQTAEQFASNLASMILQGVMTPDEAKAVAAVLGEQLDDERFGVEVIGELREIIGANGKRIEDDPVRVALEIDLRRQQVYGQVQESLVGVQDLISESLGIDLMDDLTVAYDMFGGGITGALAMTLGQGGMIGVINVLSKQFADWGGWIGDSARQVQSFLNPELAAAYETASEAGSMIGNIVSQGADNIEAVQQRVLTLEEQIEAARARNSQKSTERTRKEIQVLEGVYNRSIRQQQQMLESQQRMVMSIYEDFGDTSKGLIGEQQVTLDEGTPQERVVTDRFLTEAGKEVVNGMNESIKKAFEGNDFEQMAFDSIDFESALDAQNEVYLKLNLQSGTLTPSELQTLLDVIGGNVDTASEYLMAINTKFEGDSKAAGDVIASITGAGFDQQFTSQLLYIIQSEGLTPEELETLQGTMTELALVENEDLKKILAVDALGMSEEEVKVLNEDLKLYNDFPDNMQKVTEIAYLESGTVGFANAIDNVQTWQNIENQELSKKATIDMVTEDFDVKRKEAREFVNADEEKKIEILAEWSKPDAAQTKALMEGIVPDQPTILDIQVEADTKEANNRVTNLTNKAEKERSFQVDALVANANREVDALIAKVDGQTYSTTVNVIYNPVGKPPELPYRGGLIGSKGKYPGGKRYAAGGDVAADFANSLVPGDGSRDTVPALLTPGEFVIRKAAVEKYGAGFFRALNMSAYAAGGSVGMTSSVQRFNKGGEAEKQKRIKDAIKGFEDNLVEMVKTFAGINLNLKDFMKGTNLLAKSVVKGGGLEQALRRTGISEQAIDQILSMGAEAARKWYDKNVKKGKLDKSGRAQVAAMNAAFVGEQMSGYQSRVRTARSQTVATRYLTGKGARQDVVDEIGGDPESAQAFNLLLQERVRAENQLAKAQKSGDKDAIKKATKNLRTANKAINQYQQGVRKAIDAEEAMAKALDPVGWAIEKIDEARQQTLNKFGVLEAKFAAAFGAMERAARPGIEAARQAVEAAQDNIDLIQEEIDKLEDKNERDQFEIRGLERKKDLIQRQIDANDRLNEADQRRIEKLQREDELRNRAAESLERELSQLSNQETKIQEAYQQRISALDKVSSINQNILDQQKSMLNIGQSLAQGDIYAAAQAVQERRAQQAQFAADQARSALESASENAVANLRTSSGLTREEAEARIESIREQSYQTSLKIRDIEDEIYKRNQLNVPLMDQMRVIDDQILVIQDKIYDRETKILTIQRDQLKPAEKALEDAQKILERREEKLENDKANLKIDGLTYEQLQDQIASEAEAYDLAVAQIRANEENLKSIENIVRKWEDVSKAIAKANRLARTKGEDERGVARSAMNRINTLLEKGKITKKEAEERRKAVRDRLREKLEEIEEQRKAAIEAARERGIRNQRGYADSQYYKGGSVRKYAAGSFISGDGARDSVSALLSPGEFVMRRAAVNKYGLSMMDSINNGSFSLPSYSAPAPSSSVSPSSARVRSTSNISPVYNSYGINVNVSGTNASADEIANRTVSKIREMQNMRIRSARV